MCFVCHVDMCCVSVFVCRVAIGIQLSVGSGIFQKVSAVHLRRCHSTLFGLDDVYILSHDWEVRGG